MMRNKKLYGSSQIKDKKQKNIYTYGSSQFNNKKQKNIYVDPI